MPKIFTMHTATNLPLISRPISLFLIALDVQSTCSFEMTAFLLKIESQISV